jgi:hypothetical protein
MSTRFNTIVFSTGCDTPAATPPAPPPAPSPEGKYLGVFAHLSNITHTPVNGDTAFVKDGSSVLGVSYSGAVLIGFVGGAWEHIPVSTTPDLALESVVSLGNVPLFLAHAAP